MENIIKIIGITGVNGVGKSTISNMLMSYAIDYEHVATDTLLALKRNGISDKGILAKSSYTAWELYGSPTKENIIKGFSDYRKILEDDLRTLLNRAKRLRINMVFEGIELIPELFVGNSHIEAKIFVLGINDCELHRKRIYEKCNHRPELLDRFENFFDYIRQVQSFIIEESRMMEHIYIENDQNPKQCLNKILERL